MSSNATFDSRTPFQVSEGVGQKTVRSIRTRKSKCSKSSGSLAKSVICSSCDDGELSEQDAGRKRLSTSDASSTNVIFFKEVTDSSNNSTLDERRVPLRPGKRRSVCSRLGTDRKKVKVFKGVEGNEDSLENFCELHKQLRLKLPEKKYTRKRPSVSDILKFQKSQPKGDQIVRIKKPSTAGVVNDVPETKYPESIFKVFLKNQDRVVRKRLVLTASNEGSQAPLRRLQRPLKNASKTLLERGNLERKKSPLAFVKLMSSRGPGNKSRGPIAKPLDPRDVRTPASEEIGDCGVITAPADETNEELEKQAAKKSKSTLKSHDNVKPTLSKRSVHFDEEVVAIQKSSDESGITAETWEMTCVERANQIRRAYRKNIGNMADKHRCSKGALQRDKNEKALELFDYSQKCSGKLRNTIKNKRDTTAQFEPKCDKIVMENVEILQNSGRTIGYRSGVRKNGSELETNMSGMPKRKNMKSLSSSASEINIRRVQRRLSETSEEDEYDNLSTEAEISLKHRIRARVNTRRNSEDYTDATCSSIDDDDDFKSAEIGSRRTRTGIRRSSDDLVVLRRTSSPAILKTKDSLSLLVRGKSSPAMNRRKNLIQSKSTSSSASYMSQSSLRGSNNSFGKGERSHPGKSDCLYEQARMVSVETVSTKRKLVNEKLKKANGNHAVIRAVKEHRKTSSTNTLKPRGKEAALDNEPNPLSFINECLKTTEECLERLKSTNSSEPRDTAEMIKRIRSKLSKIRQHVDNAHNDKQRSKSNLKFNKTPISSEPEPQSHPNKTKVSKDPKESYVTNDKISAPKVKKNSSTLISSVKCDFEIIKSTNSNSSSTNNLNINMAMSEKGRKILENWEKTKKSIGERSEKLLKSIRMGGERKESVICSSSSNTNLGKERVSNKGLVSTEPDEHNNKMVIVDKKCHYEEQNEGGVSNDEAVKKMSNTDKIGTILEYKNYSETLNKSSNSHGKEELLKNTEAHEENPPTADVGEQKLLEKEDQSILPSKDYITTTDMMLCTHNDKDSDKGGEEIQEVENENYHTLSSGKLQNVSLKSDCSVKESNSNVDKDHDSESSSPSLEHVTTVSMDSEPTVGKTTSFGRHSRTRTSSQQSSRPTSRCGENAAAERPSSSISRRSVPERPPSRKPYFDRKSSDDLESDNTSLTLVRIQSRQPRSSNSPASLRMSADDRNTREMTNNEQKKPPPSRMYSTLKEPHSDKKESLKSAINDFNLSPKPSLKKVTLSTPPSANSPCRGSQQKTTETQSASAQQSTPLNTPEVNGNLSRSICRSAYLSERIASISRRASTPKGSNEIVKSGAESRASTPCTPKQRGGSSSRNSTLSTKNEQQTVSFESGSKRKMSCERKPQDPQRLSLNKRLPPNYLPPWEKVDLRPPERALAERARHEQRLFGGPRRLSRRSDLTRPVTPIGTSPEPKTPTKSLAAGNSGTPTNSSLTVSTNNVSRHVRIRQRQLERVTTKQFKL